MLSHFAITQQGESHIKRKVPCQDYSRSVRISAERFQREFLLGVISDGVGSCQYSQYGSETAVNTVVDVLTTGLEKELPELTDREILALMKRAFDQALNNIEDKAAEMELPMLEFDCTLTAAVYDGSNLWFGHIGDDGIVVMYNDGTYEMITTRHKGEEAHSVYPLFCRDKWQFGKVDKPTAACVLMTDGVLDYCVDIEAMHNRVYYPFLAFCFSEVMDTEEKQEASCKGWAEYLAGKTESPDQPRFRNSVTDDITLAVLQNSEAAAALPEITFDSVKWDEDTRKRREEQDKKLYGDYWKYKEELKQKKARAAAAQKKEEDQPDPGPEPVPGDNEQPAPAPGPVPEPKDEGKDGKHRDEDKDRDPLRRDQRAVDRSNVAGGRKPGWQKEKQGDFSGRYAGKRVQPHAGADSREKICDSVADVYKSMKKLGKELGSALRDAALSFQEREPDGAGKRREDRTDGKNDENEDDRS